MTEEQIKKNVTKCVANQLLDCLLCSKADEETVRRIACGEITDLEEVEAVLAKYHWFVTPEPPPNDPILTPSPKGVECDGRDMCCEECEYALICWANE